MDLKGIDVVLAPDDRGIADALVSKLHEAGANARFWSDDAASGDVLIDLKGFVRMAMHPVKRSFEHAKLWMKNGSPHAMASGLGGVRAFV